ncbi:TetR/AcrR family transcriptional regulator [Streptacidiphilus anmyonensis]|uniref:TetR/AcrR family transcriptional regulator n=1 Tax=Streptacidiphilus anmyonensis TaxID=405782 RepID=UPI000A92D5E6|nr:TetR/AcrR family transcriptional regulator [Streptacidiphilus anmyonensis]
MGKAGTKGVARPERERQIVDIAGRVFADHGYAGTSLTAVAEQAGISKPLIYNYFGSKEGLFAACLTCAGEALAEVIEGAAELGLVGQESVVVTLDRVYAALEPRPWMWRGSATRPCPPRPRSPSSATGTPGGCTPWASRACASCSTWPATTTRSTPRP